MMAIISVTNDVAQQRNNSQVDGIITLHYCIFSILHCGVIAESTNSNVRHLILTRS